MATATDYFKNRVAIVTGGASGIGKALCEELGRKGVTVIVADVNGNGAKEVASGISQTDGRAYAAKLDVSQAREIENLIDKTVAENGQIDYMFNNAGISICGELRDIELEHWLRVFNINLWGVIYGTTAAYRVMVKQGFGHIVNTASLGGLMPEPMATPYVTTKYGVVGLSMALRLEAAELGVKVSVACPGMVKTRVLESAIYIGVKPEEAIAEMSVLKTTDARKCAQKIIRGVEQNRAIITDSALSQIFWWLYRINPAILNPFLRKGMSDMRALRIQQRNL